MLDSLRRRHEHARRRLARLTQAAALGGVSLALLAPPASGAVAPTPQASGDDNDPRDARTGERPRMDRPLDRPVRAATPQAETVLAGLRQAQASGGITPSFGSGADNPFGLNNVGANIEFAIGDLDSDGDLDVITTNGNADGFVYFENTPETDGTPSFSRSTNPFGLNSVAIGVADSHPTIGDLDGDGDGDMDILLGQYYDGGGFLYFENTPGTGGVPSFTSVVENPFGLTATPGYPGLDVGQTNAIVDLDGDGDVDVLAGSTLGELFYFENTAPEPGVTTAASVTGDEGWRMLAAPASGATVADLLGDVWTQGFPGSDGPGGDPNVFLYDEDATGGLSEGYRAPTSADEAPGLGRGLLAYLYTDDDFTEAGTQGGFPKPLSVLGDRPLNSFTWGGVAEGALSFTDTGEPTEDGWNLLGNPFASWFDWDAVDLNDIDAPVYVYDDATSTFRSYSTGAGSLPGGVVGPFQGFWVQATGSEAGLSARAAVSNGGPLYRQAAPLTVGLALRPADDSRPERSEAHVVLGTPGSETTRDRLDAYALAPLAPSYVQVASLAASGEGERLALSVDHRPDASGTTEIPLTVSAVGVEGATRLVLTWPGLDTLPEGTSVRLVDHQTGAEIDLARETAYAFEVTPEASGAGTRDVLAPPAPRVQRTPESSLTDDSRFALVIERAASTSTEAGAGRTRLSEVMPNPTRGRAALRLSVGTPQRVRATVYDALGREVAVAFDAEVASSAEVAVETRGLAAGAYVVRVVGETFAETRRLTVTR